MINILEDERLKKLNHSCAHLMAQAIRHLYPEVKFWVGPAIEEGFYYDMDLGNNTITEDDFEYDFHHINDTFGACPWQPHGQYATYKRQID